LFVDKAQLELALLNLILNARDAMPDGGTVTVSIDQVNNQQLSDGGALPLGDYVRIKVDDEGAGIAQDEIDKITQPFYTTKEAGKGTGLGLSMVLGFVQQSGGRLLITSELRVGTTVEMILPSTRQREPERAKQKQPTAAAKVRSILLVDDDIAVRTVIGEQLREHGFDVVAASDGAGAISSLNNGAQFDVLLSDFAMPGMNGVQTIAKIKSLRPDIRSALMTGYADDNLTDINRNAITVFRKPIDFDDLLEFLAS
jgi:CheY-like chemotaxis protein